MNGEIPHVHSWENDVVKGTVFPKLIYRFNAISTGISGGFFVNSHRLILKFL
jgi:hypothetical protein